MKKAKTCSVTSTNFNIEGNINEILTAVTIYSDGQVTIDQ